MKFYIIHYKNGEKQKAEAKSDLELIKKYDLASKKNLGVKIQEIANY